jgi:hypothetical protein
MGEQLYSFTESACQNMTAVVDGQSNQSSKTTPRAASTLRFAGITLLIGKLTAAVTDSSPGTFQAWGSPNPTNSSSAEVALTGFPPLPVYSWGWDTSTQIPSTASVIVGFICGRWYILDGPCPTPIDEGS